MPVRPHDVRWFDRYPPNLAQLESACVEHDPDDPGKDGDVFMVTEVRRADDHQQVLLTILNVVDFGMKRKTRSMQAASITSGFRTGSRSSDLRSRQIRWHCFERRDTSWSRAVIKVPQR